MRTQKHGLCLLVALIWSWQSVHKQLKNDRTPFFLILHCSQMQAAITGWIFELHWRWFLGAQERGYLMKRGNVLPTAVKGDLPEMHSLAHSLMQKWCTLLGEQSLHMLCVQAYRYTYIIYCTVSLKQLYKSNNPLNVVQSLSTWGPAVMGHSWDSALDGPYHQRYKQFAVPHLQPSFSLRKVHLRMYFFTLKV